MAVLFDLDGTLTDPKAGIVASVHYALDRLGVAAPRDDEMDGWIGPPIQDSFARLLGRDPTEAVRLYRTRYGQIGLLENAVYPGIIQSLERLRNEGLALFVATSKPEVFARQILDHFDLARHFDGIYGSELDGRLSAKGELIAHLLAEQELRPGGTVMVGDREHDVLAARANGIPCLGVTYGYGTAEELDEAGAAALCGRPDRMAESVLELLGTLALSCEGMEDGRERA